jgi:hypothetical protein
MTMMSPAFSVVRPPAPAADVIVEPAVACPPANVAPSIARAISRRPDTEESPDLRQATHQANL